MPSKSQNIESFMQNVSLLEKASAENLVTGAKSSKLHFK